MEHIQIKYTDFCRQFLEKRVLII